MSSEQMRDTPMEVEGHVYTLTIEKSMGNHRRREKEREEGEEI